jgi:hypothetical protein
MLPEAGGIDTAVFDKGQGCLNSVNIVDREQARDSQPPRNSRDETGHPIVAVNEIGLNPWDDVVDDLSLKGKGELDIFIPVF